MKLRTAFSYLLSLVFISCISNLHSGSMKYEFDLQGHRGCRGLMPENTIPAMLKATELGVTTLEMDVVISADQKVLLSHEPWMNEEITTKPDGISIKSKAEALMHNIYKLTHDEIKKYDVGIRVHPRFMDQKKMAVSKPLLEDVIIAVESYQVANRKFSIA